MASIDPQLVSLEEFKGQLRITHTNEDLDLEGKLFEAHDIVLQYVTDPGSPAWDEESVPNAVKSAILQVATNLYRHRGDDGTEDGPLTGRAQMTLRPFRDPPLG